MTKPSPFRVVEVYSFNLADVVGPFLSALGQLAGSIETSRDQIRTESAPRLNPDK
jgi:hypothetical protein